MSASPAAVEHAYRYLVPSSVESSNGERAVSLATSGGCDANPWLASGFVVNSRESSRALVAVGENAATRFWTPPNMVAEAIRAADPVVTTAAEAIRFESFSLCGGVYATFDLRADYFDGDIVQHGTTNIDMGRELKRALSQIGGRDPLKLNIGRHSVEATTLTDHVVERKIPLPERWIRGFANVSLACSGLEPKLTLSGAGFRQFVHSISTTASISATGSSQTLWAVPSGSSLRFSGRPGPVAVQAKGLERLSPFRVLLPHIKSVVAYGSGIDAATRAGPTAWVAEIDGGRVTVALSASVSRGFSGEGDWLLAQADSDGGVGDHLDQATAGRRGFDVHRSAWFERDLPFDRGQLDRGAKRLRDARRLAESGSVTLQDGRATVISGQSEYSVNVEEQSCTCPWWGQHQGSRGPCKHVLAAIILSP